MEPEIGPGVTQTGLSLACLATESRRPPSRECDRIAVNARKALAAFEEPKRLLWEQVFALVAAAVQMQGWQRIP